MASVSLDIRGDRELMRKFDRLDGDMPRVMGLIAKGVGSELKNEMMIYPQQRATPYVRTGRLKRNWHVERRGISQAVVGNPVSYAAYVQEKRKQAAIHRQWWAGHTDEDKIEKLDREGIVEQTAKRVIERVLKFTGLA